MEDIPDSASSPSRKSLLKPPKPRVPLRNLLSPAPEEDNTAARKRRVSFANVNRIKRFSAVAESMVVCHTPAYEEPFALSSDSSCPSGLDGETPVKNSGVYEDIPAMFYAEQKENLMVANDSSLIQNQFSSPYYMCYIGDKNQNKKEIVMSSLKTPITGAFKQCNNIVSSQTFVSPKSEMDMTSCIVTEQQMQRRRSTRSSVGMDFTSVVGDSLIPTHYSTLGINESGYVGESMKNTRYSSLGMDLTGGVRQSMKNTRYSTQGMDFTDVIGESCYSNQALDGASFVEESMKNTRYSTRGMDLTGVFRDSVKNTRYSTQGMDFTDVIGESLYYNQGIDGSFVGESMKKTRYSTQGMDMTDVIGEAHYSNQEMVGTGFLGESMKNTRYSTQGMDMTDVIGNSNQEVVETGFVGESMKSTRYSTQGMDMTDVIGDSNQEMVGTGFVGESMKSTRYSTQGMDLTKAAISHQSTNCNYDGGLDESGVFELTNAVSKPRLSTVSSTIYPANNMNLTENVVDTGVDFTRADVSQSFRGRRKSARYSVYNMDLTEAIDNVENSSLDFTEVECDPKIEPMSTNYSMNDTRLTETAVGKNYSKFNSSNIECSKVVGNELDYSANSETSMDFTKPIITGVDCKGNARFSMKSMDCINIARNSSAYSTRSEIGIDFTKTVCEEPIINQSDNDRMISSPCSNAMMTAIVDGRKSICETKEEEIDGSCGGPSDKTYAIKDRKSSLEPKCNEKANRPSIEEESGLHSDTSKLSKVLEIVCDENSTTKFTENECRFNVTELKSFIKTLSPVPQNVSLTNNDSMKNQNETRSILTTDTFKKERENNIFIEPLDSSLSNLDLTPGCPKGIKNPDEHFTSTQTKIQNLDINQSSLLECSKTTSNNKCITFEEECEKVDNGLEKENENTELCTGVAINVNNIRKQSLSMDLTQQIISSGLQKEMSTIDISVLSLKRDNNDTTINEDVTAEQKQSLDEEDEMTDAKSFTNTEAMDVDMTSNDGCKSKTSDVAIFDKPNTLSSIGIIRIENSLQENRSLVIDDNKEMSDCKILDVNQELQECTFNLHMSYDSLLNNSCSRNITMSRGGNRFNTSFPASHDLVGEASRENSMLQNAEQTSALETLPLNQHLVMNRDILCSETLSDVDPHFHKKENGGKRSFEEALQPENDIVESPVKLVCIEERNHRFVSDDDDLLMNISARSFLLDTHPNKTFPILESENTSKVTSTTVESKMCSLHTQEQAKILSKLNHVRSIGEGVYICQFIPKWVELQFSMKSYDHITGVSYNIICRDTIKSDRAVGEYLLWQIKSMMLPEDLTDVQILQQDSICNFLAKLASDLSFICKYCSGTLKGNILTIQVISCQRQFWAFIDVNLTVPRKLSLSDIKVSEQRMGELKVSEVHEIFNQCNRGPDQMKEFAVALHELQYFKKKEL